MKTRALLLLLLVFFAGRAAAQSVALLDGVVVAGGKGQPGVVVQAAGNNTRVAAVTDAEGRFRFTTLQPGSYVLTARTKERAASLAIALPASGASVTLVLQLHVVSSVLAHPASPALHGSGTDLTLSPAVLAHSVAATNFPNLLLQLPGAARGANGAVHINGDHGDIGYVVDGIPMPQELNRTVGNEFDLNDAAFIDVVEGAYPARYGGRFASVIEVSTRSGSAAQGYAASAAGDTSGGTEGSVAYFDRVGQANVVFSARADRAVRGLDPPNLGTPVHDQAASANAFLRVTVPSGTLDYLNFEAAHTLQTFQIPNDVPGGEPFSTDDNETQDDTFALASFHHAIGTTGSLTAGVGVRRSRIQDFGDPANDFAYGQSVYAAAGGNPSDCANALSGAPFTASTCAYSLTGDRTATDEEFLSSYTSQQGRHTLRAGLSYDHTDVSKRYAVTLQPNNFLAPIYSPSAPGAPYTVVDDAPNSGNTESVYVEDTWRLGPLYEMQYGLRQDAYQLGSTQFQDAASQLSPRVKVTRFFGPRAAVYVYYGRFFTPFSFENVSPAAAHLLNLPLQRSVAAFDLRPQRDSDYEVGAHLPLGSGTLGVRVMQKNAADLIDDTQVGLTALHQDINYALGRIATQTAYFQHPAPHDGSWYLSLNHTYSVNKGCETQLLAPCFGSPTDWTPADHEQRWGATAGIVVNSLRGNWFSADSEYGSGLSSSACAPAAGFCKYTPHTVFDAEEGLRLSDVSAVVVRVQNLLNDRYFVTYFNAQGNHVYAPRTISVEFRLHSAAPR
ncbi:MAG TPA: carboxypeptidase regulatory-like domain-containing protein [Candidatus Baltobacteraceae bacterium]|nr:carboxypeptidase regulatory-like domain-containing protein [Candidatus Baltobacteraceae bacterium]